MAGTWRRAIGVVAVLLVGLSLVPGGAHLAELPNKMRLAPADYMTVQTIYAGWALWGFVIIAALAAIFAHAIAFRHDSMVRWLSLGAFTALLTNRMIFWTYTLPVNKLTRHWTITPPDLELARRQWEYSHAANAVFTFVAFVLITLAALRAAGRRA